MKRNSLATIATLILSFAAMASGAQAPGMDKAQFDAAIHDYLLTHPEVLLESVKAYDLHMKEVAQQKVRDNVRSHLAELTGSGHIVASKAADAAEVTVVEFFDYRCGFCKKAAGTVLDLAKTPGVKIIYKELPILGSDSLVAAQAALAAEKQGLYEKLHNAMLASPEPLTAAVIDKLARQAGLDLVRLKKDMASPEVNRELAANEELAQKLDIGATPTFVVGDELKSGALTTEAFRDLIASARQAPLGVASLNQPVVLK